MDFTIDASDILRDAAKLQAAESVVRDELTHAMTRSVSGLALKTKELTPTGKTGKLRNSFTQEVRPAGSTITGTVGTNVFYARWVHDGRGKVIARRSNVLRFTIGSVVFYRKWVGPSRPNPFMTKGMAASRGAIAKEFAQVIPRVAKRLGL